MISLGMGVNVNVSIPKIDFLVSIGRSITAGGPLIARLVFELLRFGAIERVVENEFAEFASKYGGKGEY
jgi:hypothetical protein